MELTITVLAVLSCVVYTESKAKHVTVQLEAKWKSTSVLLEASEFIAKESNNDFWRFVNDLYAKGPMGSRLANDEERYAHAIKLAKGILSPLQLKLMKFALSLRAHSPTVEMYQQMAIDKQPPGGDCRAFVEVNNMITCEQGAMLAFINMASDQSKPTLLTNDHTYPGSEGKDVIVILYAEIGTPPFLIWHAELKKLAEEKKITYVLRHFSSSRPDRQVRLSGYGVELAIKNQEYKAKDDTKVETMTDEEGDDLEEVQGFVFSTLKKLHPELVDNLNEFKQHLVDSTKDLAPLKVWQLQDLSFQAAQIVMEAPPGEQLQTLQDLSQNFPIMARSLLKAQVSDAFRKEVKKNQEVFQSTFGLDAGDSAMFINGLQVHLDVYDVFTLLETMRTEAKLMEGLYNLASQYDVGGQKMLDLLKLDLRDADVTYALDIRDESILFVNDLEKDRRYAGWPNSVQDILRPTFPGMLRHVRKNFFHLVFMVNPANKQYKDLLKMAEAFFVHNAPIRVGFLFVVKPGMDDAYESGLAMVRAFNYVKTQEGPAKALSFITDVLDLDGSVVDKQDIISEFAEKPYKADLHEVFETDRHDGFLEAAVEYFDKTGLRELPQVLMNGVPMKQQELESEEFEESVVSSILKGTSVLQSAVYNGHLSDKEDILEYMMTQKNVVARINSHILSTSLPHLDLSAQIPAAVFNNKDGFSALHPAAMGSALLQNLKYLTKKDDGSSNSVTNWIVADLNTPEGRSLAYAAVKHLKHSAESRIGFIHNALSISSPREAFFISHAIQVALDVLEPSMAKMFITKLLKEENVQDLLNGHKKLEELAVNNMDFSAYDNERESSLLVYVHNHREFVQRVLNFAPGERGVICNGRVIGPLKADEMFIQEDFDLLDKYTDRVSAGKIKKKVKQLGVDGGIASDLVMRVSSLLTSVSQKEGRKDIAIWENMESVIAIPPQDSNLPAYEIVAILDPTTRAAQKYTPILRVLQDVANVDIRIFFNCKEKLSEMPLNSFYRYVLDPELQFAVDSSLASGPIANFQNMPETPLLTLGMDPPDNWLVEAVHTSYDLDNIYLAELGSSVHAIYELEYLLLEGHCYDSVSGQPPRGLQFILGTNKTQDMVDTIVMANLGYFQLKATPGVWNLRLRVGRSREIYEIVGHESTDSPSNSQNVIAVIDSFKSKIIRIKVTKKTGMEGIDLLDEEEPKKGLWNSISSTLTGSGDGKAASDVINIFSVASGHLYERLMRIMMLSVMKHTKTPVKFWFLENYLSPTFKDFIPHLAKEYGFDYQLVQYHWPRWLHQQSEKQRIIWGYKILFLDVLFPLNVSKIIFVDADQIVRTDLKELMDFDLEGAPYGYTPFCDSRTEMDGFRFWKSGYWASHLSGRKYHISALYVVDLKKFRKIAAGDRLRGQYQGLSQDPNSLSNLDQDLPNNMIHQVAIKSLPQEWLYCDTWCSSDTLKYAKTIDLCNNPLTKEPKLSAAARLIPEWSDYDQEIKLLWDQVYGTKTAAANMATNEETDKKNVKIEL